MVRLALIGWCCMVSACAGHIERKATFDPAEATPINRPAVSSLAMLASRTEERRSSKTSTSQDTREHISLVDPTTSRSEPACAFIATLSGSETGKSAASQSRFPSLWAIADDEIHRPVLASSSRSEASATALDTPLLGHPPRLEIRNR